MRIVPKKDTAGQGGLAGTEFKDWSPEPFTGADPAFNVEGWKGLDIKNGKEIDAETMARHFLILGETGSGKTKSGVEPLLRSILGYKSLEGENASVLVIDPKVELRKFVEKVMGSRFGQEAITLDLDEDKYCIDVFERERTDGQCNLSAREVIELVKPFAEGLSQESKVKRDSYWNNTAIALMSDVLGVLIHCHKRGFDFWVQFAKQCWLTYEKNNESFLKKYSEQSNQSGKDYEEAKDVRDRWFSFFKLIESYNFKYRPDNFFLPMKWFFDLTTGWRETCWQMFSDACVRLSVPHHLSAFSNRFKKWDGDNSSTLLTMVPRFIGDLTSPKLVRTVWLNPFEPPIKSLRIEDVVNDGKVLIYSPKDNSFIIDAIGKLLKSRFFKATFTRKNKKRPVAYVCDEFQRFITGDPESGEQAFLDRCRAYRGICVLATQSIASIQKALYDTGENDNSAEACISIILNNTGTKLFFRNTDSATQARIAGLIPKDTTSCSWKKSHIMDVRPITTLRVGECYYLLSNGKWGRTQISLTEQLKQANKIQTERYASVHCETVRLKGEVTPESILELCSAIDAAVYYYHFRHIKIEICSPGGELLALQHYLSKLAEWRNLGVIVETVAIMSVASAAAIILSLGDVGYRSAYPVAKLVYHNGRAKPPSFCTKEDFAQFCSALERIDNHLQAQLIRQIYGDDDNSPKALIDLFALRERELDGKKMNHFLPTLDGLNDDGAKNPSRGQYETVLKELLDKDIQIDPMDARLLGLIDNVIGEIPSQE